MVILSFLRCKRFWLPLLLLLLIELWFRSAWWESQVNWSSHAGRSIASKRAVQSLQGAAVDYVMLGDSRARQGFQHRALAEQARRHARSYINLALPGVHFLSLKTWARYTHEQFPQLRGMILVIHPDFLQSKGNGEYELGIVRPLRAYTSSREVQQHVPLERNKLSTWSSLANLIGYREEIQSSLASGFSQQRVGSVELGRWWLEWTAEYPENLCSIDLAQAQLCSAMQQLSQPDEAQRNVQQFCARPSIGEKMDPATAQHWQQQVLPELTQEWRQFLTELSAQHDLIVVSLPQLPLFDERMLWPAAQQAGDALLRELADQGRLDWLDLRQLVATQAEPACEYFRDPWHMNQNGQALASRMLEEHLERRWYRQ